MNSGGALRLDGWLSDPVLYERMWSELKTFCTREEFDDVSSKLRAYAIRNLIPITRIN